MIRSLDSVKVPAARAIIIWMVGEYSSLGETIPRTLSTVLKYLAWHFTSEALETKLQILNSIVKVCMRTFLQFYFNLIDYFYILVENILCSSVSLFSIKQATKAINIHFLRSVKFRLQYSSKLIPIDESFYFCLL